MASTEDGASLNEEGSAEEGAKILNDESTVGKTLTEQDIGNSIISDHDETVPAAGDGQSKNGSVNLATSSANLPTATPLNEDGTPQTSWLDQLNEDSNTAHDDNVAVDKDGLEIAKERIKEYSLKAFEMGKKYSTIAIENIKAIKYKNEDGNIDLSITFKQAKENGLKLTEYSKVKYDEYQAKFEALTGGGHAKSTFYPTDFRIERCIALFDCNPMMLEVFWNIFQHNDRERNNMINLEHYYEKMLEYPRNSLTDSMLELINSKSDTGINFGEFVELSCTFACFEQVDLVKYIFYILDPSKTDLIEKNEVKHFIVTIWNNEINSNIKTAMGYLDEIDLGEGTFNFKEIMSLNNKYPNVFYPLFRLQIVIIKSSLGETWWDKHKAHLTAQKRRKREKELAALKAKLKQEANANQLFDDELVKKRMGYFKFTFMPWLREVERNKLLRIAAIEDELMGGMETDNKNGNVDFLGL